MIFGFVIVCTALVLGELLVRGLDVPVPGSVVGLVLLFVVLRLRWIDPSAVRKASDLLVRRMGLFFVPAGVIAISRHGTALWGSLGVITVASVASFLVVLLVVGRWLQRRAPS